MSEIIFRPATPADVEPIIAIARRIWTMGMNKRLEDRFGPLGGESWQQWTARDIGGAVRGNLENCLVAEADGRIVGWVTWSVNPQRREGRVGYNGVAPEFRGQGLGTALVQQALAKLRAAGCRFALVVTGLDEGHAPARRVYEKCGFQPFHQSVTYLQEL